MGSFTDFILPPLSLGTGRLDEAKSKFGPGAPKNTAVVYEAAGDNVKVTIDGTDSNERQRYAVSTLASTNKPSALAANL